MKQLAQINIAKFIKPMQHSANVGFVNAIEEINTLAEASDGFVWRLKDGSEDGLFHDARIITTISVWESVEALKAFSYRSDHVNVFRKRAAWFERMTKANYALWWIEEGNFPTALEAKKRIEHLWENGASDYVFDFKNV